MASVVNALGSNAPLTLVALLGPDGLRAAAQRTAHGPHPDGAHPALAQILNMIATLQKQLNESEGKVHEFQAQVDELEEQRRIGCRRAERAERARDQAVQRADDAEENAEAMKRQGVPLVERYMEREVLRSQLQALEEENARIVEERMAVQQELARSWPRLSDAEDAEALCTEAINELETAHSEEIVVLRAAHTEEIADLRSSYATSVAELETTRQTEIASLRCIDAEEIGMLRSAVEEAEWQADVFVREHQDSIREASLRQRENTRLAKRRAEAEQESRELQVKVEAIQAAAAGAPPREAELGAVQQRCKLLERTAEQWRRHLARKQNDCDEWRQRATHPGAIPLLSDKTGGEATIQFATSGNPSACEHQEGIESRIMEVDSGDGEEAREASPERLTPVLPSLTTSGPASAPASEPASAPISPASQKAALGSEGLHFLPLDPLLSSLPTRSNPWPGIPTPSRTPQRARQHSRLQAGLLNGQFAPSRAPASGARSVPRLAMSSAARNGAVAALSLSPPQSRAPEIGPAQEYVAVALRIAQLQTEDVDVRRASRSHDVLDERGRRWQQTEDAIQEAENELEMLSFLLGDKDAEVAENLLKFETQRQPVMIAQRLHSRLDELTARTHHSIECSRLEGTLPTGLLVAG